MTSPFVRRHWKLKAVKAFAEHVSLPLSDIRRTVGDRVFDDLFNEAYKDHPTDPHRGAQLAYEKLNERHSEQLKNPIRFGTHSRIA